MSRLSLFFAGAIVLLCSFARADSWMPFRDLRAVSPSGGTYVVLRNTKAGIQYELVLRRDGAGPMTAARAADLYGLREGTGGSIDRDPEDKVLATGTVPQLPMEVRVTDEPAGFVLFEKYANIGYGDSVTFVDAKRGVAFRKTLDDIFGPLAAGRFTASVSSIWWYSGFYVDESRGRIVVVGDGDLLREVSIADGTVGTP